MPNVLNNLGIAFQKCFECTGDLANIGDAISYQQKAVQLTPEGHASMAGWLTNLGNAFLSELVPTSSTESRIFHHVIM